MKRAVRGNIIRTNLLSLTFICYNERWQKQDGLSHDRGLALVVVSEILKITQWPVSIMRSIQY
jgi:hypothetical protein